MVRFVGSISSTTETGASLELPSLEIQSIKLCDWSSKEILSFDFSFNESFEHGKSSGTGACGDSVIVGEEGFMSSTVLPGELSS